MRLVRTVVIALLLGGLVVGCYWYFLIRPRMQRISGEFEQPAPSRLDTLDLQNNPDSDFDQTIALPADPIGVGAHGDEFVLGNRAEPFGFLRVHRASSDRFEAQTVPVIESGYGQKIGLDTVTWNGKEYVGCTTAEWFQRKGKVFTVHDPKTLAVQKYYPAPDLIGGVAWDGEGYWAATRRNTADSSEPAFLYHLDADFRVINKYDPPDVGCQGLAWDGKFLWFVDVFSGSIHVLDVAQEPPRTVKTYSTSFQYLSGVAFDGKAIWISEYGDKRLHRLKPELRAEWTGVAEPEETIYQAQPEEAKQSDTYTNSFSSAGDDEADVLELKAEIRGDSLLGSWKIHFGQNLFTETSQAENSVVTMPVFAKYRVTVESDSLEKRKEIEYEAEVGENERTDELLLSDLDPGEYAVSIFIHVQYVDAEGTNRIINNSCPAVRVTRP